MQFVFGAGVLIGTPLTDAYGNAIANPTPVEFGKLQDVSLDISFETKTAHGNNQFAIIAARGKGKISGKAKILQLNSVMLDKLVFGQGTTAGILSDVYDTTGAVIPTTPYQITPTVPSSGTWTRDLGVKNANGQPLTRVASGPTTGQYSVSAGVYTFASADAATTVYINFQYTATSTTAKKDTIQNVLMGYAPTFAADLYFPFQGKSLIFYLRNVLATKFGAASKLDDFMYPEIDFEAYADASGNVFDYALTE